MLGAIDVGSNTVRLLIADEQHRTQLYHRQVTRLSGQFSNGCLNHASMDRTLAALKDFSQIMAEAKVTCYRAVATEAVRRAKNSQQFLDSVHDQTGIRLDVISGDTEAMLTTSGVLSVMDPMPQTAIIIDIGGGSTELICIQNKQTKLQHSYPLGVVRLCEEYDSAEACINFIEMTMNDFVERLTNAGLGHMRYELIGTAGTVTTLSAMQLGLTEYDVDLINNSAISTGWLSEIHSYMQPLSITEREQLLGMEAGRGDLIIPGMQILLALANKFNQEHIRVSDSGLLEGIIADLKHSNQ